MWKVPLPVAGLLIAAAGLAGFLIAGSRDRSDAERAFVAPSTHVPGTPAPADPHAEPTKTDFASAVAEIIEDRNRLRRSARLYHAIAPLSSEEMPAALNRALGLDPGKRAMVLQGLLHRWAELDLEAAARYELALPGEISRNLATYSLRTWAAKDFAAARAAVLALPPGEQRRKGLQTITSFLSETDPLTAIKFAGQHGITLQSSPTGMERRSWPAGNFEAAANYALSIEDTGHREKTLHFLVGVQANASPQQVLHWARSIPDEEVRGNVIDQALGFLARQNPNQAVAYARTLPPGELRERAFSNVVRRLAIDDVSAAQRLVEELPAGREREGAMGTLVSALEQKDTSAAVRFVLSAPAGSIRESALWSLARKLTGEDSARAMQFARDLPEGSLRNRVTQWVAEELAEKDPVRALEAARLLPPGEQRENVFESVVLTWVRSEPKAAITYALENPPRIADGRNLLADLVWNWAQQSGTEALRWAQALPEGKQREELIGVAVSTLDRPAALQQIATLTGTAQAEAATRVAGQWAREDPAAAAAWAVTLLEGAARARALSTVMDNWAQADATNSAGWLQTLPPGVSRDAAVQSFARHVTARDPQGAVSWATTIGDEARRRKTLERVARDWLERDRNAAAQWIRSTPLLSGEARDRMLGNKTNQ